jgi:hypothetical protein
MKIVPAGFGKTSRGFVIPNPVAPFANGGEGSAFDRSTRRLVEALPRNEPSESRFLARAGGLGMTMPGAWT